MMFDNILIIGAHFDDAELGVGGTASKMVEQGANVYKLTLTDNVTDFSQMGISVQFETSKFYSHQACEFLGVNELSGFSPEPCNNLIYREDIMQQIEKYIYELSIDTIFVHFDDDMNTDHIAASRISMTAGRHCQNILQYKSNGYISPKEYHPTFFVDVSNHIEKKISALKFYGKEHNRFGSLFDMIINRNQVWGYANHVEYAEGFSIVKMML